MAVPSYTPSFDFRRIVLKFALALALLMLLSWLSAVMLSKLYFTSYGGNSGAQLNYALKTRADILIVGSSRAAHHYDSAALERATGLTVYNAGKEGVNATYQYGLLSMLLGKYHPKLVVYDVADFGPNLDGGTAYLYPYYSHYPEIRKILQERDPQAKVKFLNPLYAFNGKVIDIVYDKIRNKDKPNPTGFEPRDKTIKTRDLGLLEKQAGMFTGIDTLSVRNFARSVALCREKGIPMVLIYSPTLVKTQLSGFDQIEAIANAQGVKLINYWMDERYYNNFELFYDALHLNAKGGELFTRDIASIITNEINQEIKK